MTADDVGALSFEDALARLESIVSELERGETPLEETIDRFEQGIALARRCEDRLNEADRKVAILLREGSRVVEVDLETGERLAEREDPGESVEAPARPASRPAPPPAEARRPEPAESRRPEPPGPPPRGRRSEPPNQGQMALGDAFALKNPEEMDDDDIPF